MTQISSLLTRGLFVLAFVLAGIAVWEKLSNYFGYTVVGSALNPSRILEFAGIALLFVLALLLRDIRHAMMAKSRT
jgi:hypothetical protein